MTLDEAIKHCEEVSNRERELYSLCPEEGCDGSSDCRELKHGKDRGCIRCAEEHEQLAEWLKELKRYREADIPRLQWENYERRCRMRLCDDCIYRNNCKEYQNKVIKTTPIDFDFFGCSDYKAENTDVFTRKEELSKEESEWLIDFIMEDGNAE